MSKRCILFQTQICRRVFMLHSIVLTPCPLILQEITPCVVSQEEKKELFQHRILGRFLEGWLLQDLRSRVWTASRLLRVGLWRKPHAAKQEHPGDPYLLEDGISSRFCYLHNPFGKLRFCGRIRHHVNSRRGGSERRVLPGGIVQVKKKSDSSSLSSYLGKESKK